MNIFEILNKKSNEELIETMACGENIRIERIISSGETTMPGFWYDQDENELVILLQGTAKIAFEASEVSLKKGDWIIIPKHQKHRVEHTSKNPMAIWLCIFSSNPFSNVTNLDKIL